MRVSAGSLKNFEEWMQMYEASMNERVYNSRNSLESCQIAGEGTLARTSLQIVDRAEAEQLYREDQLGCARGVLWALIFEAGLVLAALLYWKLRLFAW